MGEAQRWYSLFLQDGSFLGRPFNTQAGGLLLGQTIGDLHAGIQTGNPALLPAIPHWGHLTLLSFVSWWSKDFQSPLDEDTSSSPPQKSPSWVTGLPGLCLQPEPHPAASPSLPPLPSLLLAFLSPDPLPSPPDYYSPATHTSLEGLPAAKEAAPQGWLTTVAAHLS